MDNAQNYDSYINLSYHRHQIIDLSISVNTWGNYIYLRFCSLSVRSMSGKQRCSSNLQLFEVLYEPLRRNIGPEEI
jgi:hypothetical protein